MSVIITNSCRSASLSVSMRLSASSWATRSERSFIRFLHRFVGTSDSKERPAREEEKTTPRRDRDPKGGA